MPGTIQVTVLEFKSVSSSSSQPSAKSLKVSMGRRHFQTWDKGQFEFPLSKLREDLVVALLDSGGNEIAHADIRTIQIIEKGSWDEVFELEGGKGGGNVHLKLHFVLSEEERKRVRLMRESALKKKQETNPNINLRISESTSSSTDIQISDVVSSKSEASQDGSPSIFATSSVKAPNIYTKDQKNILETAIPNATDTSRAGSSSSPIKDEVKTESLRVPERGPAKDMEIPSANIRSGTEKRNTTMLSGLAVVNEQNLVSKSSKDDSTQGLFDKTPSNVKKMISTFEKTQPQDTGSLRKVASVPTQLNRFRKERLLEVRDSKVVIQPSESLRKQKDDFGTENLRETTASISRGAETPSRNTGLSHGRKESDSSVTPFLHQTTVVNGSRADSSPINAELSQAPTELETSVTPSLSRGKISQSDENIGRETISKESEKSLASLMKTSTVETEMEYRNSSEQQIQVAQASILSDSSVTDRRESDLKSANSINMNVDSHQKTKSLEQYKEENHACQNSGMWIFPDNTSRLCITTAGKPVTRTPAYHRDEPTTSGEKKLSAEPKPKTFEKGTKYIKEKDQKTSINPPESRSGSSPNDSSNGLAGQIIKIVVVLGFGILVLLTRQTEPRKKNKKGVTLFLHPDYIEE